MFIEFKDLAIEDHRHGSRLVISVGVLFSSLFLQDNVFSYRCRYAYPFVTFL